MIIGLSGSMGVGKSTAVKSIKESFFTCPFKLVKFAQPLYDMQEFIYSRVSSVHTRPPSFIKDRKLLQWLGTEWGRGSIGETVWVDIWKEEALTFLQNNFLDPYNKEPIVICDDVRFDNEAETIRSLGGMIIKITSEKASERIDTASGIPGHSSESGINPKLIDSNIKNDSTLANFEQDLVKAITSFVARRGPKS